MPDRAGLLRAVLGPIALALIVCCASCRSCEPDSAKSRFRLSRSGYSPEAKSLLFVVYSGSAETGRMIMYDEEKGMLSWLHQPLDVPASFAWAPRTTAFAVTYHDSRMVLYHADASVGGFDGTAIPCPVNVSYGGCAWSPNGEWLAVSAFDMRKSDSNSKLGLYNAHRRQFVLTDIGIAPSPPFWKDEATLYVKYYDSVLEVRLGSGVPNVVRTIPVDEDTSDFLGMFGDRVLTRDVKGVVKLGGKPLIAARGASGGFEVVVTESLVFVSASPTVLAVFDSDGREIARINPGRPIRFGSIGLDRNTAYGVADTTLVRVSVVNGRLTVQDICDLDDMMRRGQYQAR